MSDYRTVDEHTPYPDIVTGGCEYCTGIPLAPKNQVCDHRCTCGRELRCWHTKGSVTSEMWRALALAACDSALWAIQRGAPDEAAQYAKDCVTACRKHQLAGGHPADGGEENPFRGFSDEEMWRE